MLSSIFYKDYFSNFDCQVVLVDLFHALQQGKRHFEDTHQTLKSILNNFRYGKSTLLSRLIKPRIDRILFAATKVDQVNRSQYPNSRELLDAMLFPAARNADFANIKKKTVALASVKATETVLENSENNQPIEFVRGYLQVNGDYQNGLQEVYYPDGYIPKELPTANALCTEPLYISQFSPTVTRAWLWAKPATHQHGSRY